MNKASGRYEQQNLCCFTIARLIVALMCLYLTAVTLSAASEATVTIATSSTDDWEEKQFEGATDYQAVDIERMPVIRAHSISNASALYQEHRIDLYQTPYLNWLWRVEMTLPKLDEKTRNGDDYAARVYVVIDGGLWFWKTRALSYVWSSSMKQGAGWDNAFAGSNVRMLALKNNNSRPSVWHVEKRNVLQDLRTHFNDDIRYIDAIAIMTDTDNSKGEAIAYYGNIFFSEK